MNQIEGTSWPEPLKNKAHFVCYDPGSDTSAHAQLLPPPLSHDRFNAEYGGGRNAPGIRSIIWSSVSQEVSSSSSSTWWEDTEAWCITLGRSQNDVLCAEKSKAWPDTTSSVWGTYNPHSFVCLSERRDSCKSPTSSGKSKRSAQNQTDQGRC